MHEEDEEEGARGPKKRKGKAAEKSVSKKRAKKEPKNPVIGSPLLPHHGHSLPLTVKSTSSSLAEDAGQSFASFSCCSFQ